MTKIPNVKGFWKNIFVFAHASVYKSLYVCSMYVYKQF